MAGSTITKEAEAATGSGRQYEGGKGSNRQWQAVRRRQWQAARSRRRQRQQQAVAGSTKEGSSNRQWQAVRRRAVRRRAAATGSSNRQRRQLQAFVGSAHGEASHGTSDVSCATSLVPCEASPCAEPTKACSCLRCRLEPIMLQNLPIMLFVNAAKFCLLCSILCSKIFLMPQNFCTSAYHVAL